ncbi:MAG: hypothetical protein L0H59_07260 [Tomitella sp.]|nr:hypothetical protein [Tomitella sp.]
MSDNALTASLQPVPSGDWIVTDYQETPTRDGAAFTATLHHNGSPVGAVENRGRGGATVIRWNPGTDAAGEWDTWAADFAALDTNPYRGLPAEEAAIEALADDAFTRADLVNASRDGLVVLPKGASSPADGISVVRGLRADRAADRAGVDAAFDRYFDGIGWQPLH